MDTNANEAPAMTDWFPTVIQPVHVGVYPVQPTLGCLPEGATMFAYWNGKRFGFRTVAINETRIDAAINRAKQLQDSPTCAPPHASWRGLAEKPAEPTEVRQRNVVMITRAHILQPVRKPGLLERLKSWVTP